MTAQESKQIKRWLEYARSDLLAAEELMKSEQGFPHIIAYHCHQSAEKSLKGFLIVNQKIYPKTHDLIVLLNLCQEIDKGFKLLLSQVRVLNPLHLEEKYPFEPVADYTNKELLSFLKSARNILQFVGQQTESKNYSSQRT